MSGVFEFMNSAWPWIAMAVMLAIYSVRTESGKDTENRTEDAAEQQGQKRER